MITLEQQIKKDRENEQYRRRQRREGYRYRRQQHYNHAHQDSYKRNHTYRRNTLEADSPQSRQRSIIRISNLHYSVDKEQLESICSAFGKLRTCRIEWDKMGRSNETAIVEFFSREDEQRAMKQLKGMKIEGQEINVEVVTHSSPPGSNKHRPINKSYGNYQGNKQYRRG